MFARLLRAGFLTISCPLRNQSPVLLAQLHQEYSVLDWSALHISRKVKRLVRQNTLRERDIYLRFTTRPRAVCHGIRRAYRDDAWLVPRYAQLITDLGASPKHGVQTIATEIWSGHENRLLGGEIGYLIGATYTSLTGYMDRTAPQVDHLGKVQLTALALVLQQCGYAFWNLGQTLQGYKRDLGAAPTPRPAHLLRWRDAIQREPTCSLTYLTGQRIQCHTLLSP